MRRVTWCDLSERELKALHILVTFKGISIDDVCEEMGFSRGSFFNKINGKSKFKAIELMRLLRTIGISEEQLKELSEDKIILLLNESRTKKRAQQKEAE